MKKNIIATVSTTWSTVLNNPKDYSLPTVHEAMHSIRRYHLESLEKALTNEPKSKAGWEEFERSLFEGTLKIKFVPVNPSASKKQKKSKSTKKPQSSAKQKTAPKKAETPASATQKQKLTQMLLDGTIGQEAYILAMAVIETA